MTHLSYHSFSVYIRALGLAIVLGAAPVQNIFASTSGCVEMDNISMHHQAGDSIPYQSGNSHDCCNLNDCTLTLCATASTVGMTSNSIIISTYSVNKVYKMSPLLLTHIYPPSLYRPPKV